MSNENYVNACQAIAVLVEGKINLLSDEQKIAVDSALGSGGRLVLITHLVDPPLFDLKLAFDDGRLIDIVTNGEKPIIN